MAPTVGRWRWLERRASTVLHCTHLGHSLSLSLEQGGDSPRRCDHLPRRVSSPRDQPLALLMSTKTIFFNSCAGLGDAFSPARSAGRVLSSFERGSNRSLVSVRSSFCFVCCTYARVVERLSRSRFGRISCAGFSNLVCLFRSCYCRPPPSRHSCCRQSTNRDCDHDRNLNPGGEVTTCSSCC